MDLYECRYLQEWDETKFLDFAASDEPNGPDPDDRSIWSAGGIIIGKENPKFTEENQSQCHFSTTNLIYNALRLNLGLHG
jgi:hypothetical protein